MEENKAPEQEVADAQPEQSPPPQSEPAQETSAPQSVHLDEFGNKVTDPHHGKHSKRMKLYAVLAILVILAGLVGIVAISLSNDNDASSDGAPVIEQQRVTTLGASIATIEGSAQYSSDGDTWIDAAGGESLANLDYVRTLDDSRAIILLDDGSVVRLDSNTELYLSSLEADALEVTLLDGQIYSRVVESENQSFTVATTQERFQALGTAYKTATDGTKDTLEVYQSSVKVESDDIDIDEGNKYDTESKEKSSIDLSLLSEDDFAQWNKEKDSAEAAFKDKLGVLDQKPAEEEESAPPASTASTDAITLSGAKTDFGVKLEWSLSGVTAPNGFKVVRDKSDSTPTYKENSAQYVSGSQARSHTWYDDNGGTYYYRVCIYRDSGTCDTYSNAITVESPLVKKAPVESGSIELEINGSTITWGLVGGSAPHGYKVVLNSATGPVYPNHSIKYVSAGTTGATLPEKANGTYYVRVCKYTNGTQDEGCVDYSNEVTYIVSE